ILIVHIEDSNLGLKRRYQGKTVQIDALGHRIEEDSVRTSHRGFRLAEGIPGESKSRGEILHGGVYDRRPDSGVAWIQQAGQCVRESCGQLSRLKNRELTILRAVHQERIPPQSHV